MTDSPAPSRTTNQTYSATDVESVYLTYAVMPSPSVAKAAEMHGVSPRTAERWAIDGKWKERRLKEEPDRVALLRHAADRKLAHTYGALLDNLASLAFTAESESVRYQATVHALGIMGTDRTQRSLSVVQHLSSYKKGSGEETRTVSELAEALHARIAALGAGEEAGEGGARTPDEINDERMMISTRGVPPPSDTGIVETPSYSSDAAVPETDDDTDTSPLEPSRVLLSERGGDDVEPWWVKAGVEPEIIEVDASGRPIEEAEWRDDE